jgi:endogenous inhibitor of DNA gyrase (YacG/DUF329 family)
VKCPQCDQPLSADADARWRPFCSERCKLADLGQWFAGRYAIPAEDEAAAPESPRDPTPRQ